MITHTAMPSGEQATVPSGLTNLSAVALTGAHGQRFGEALGTNDGPPEWCARKRVEGHDLLALSLIAPSGRLRVEILRLNGDLHALVHMRVPVPCMGRDDQFHIAPAALFSLTYPREAVFYPQPGYRFVQILQPQGVWHANVSRDPTQALCLGQVIPAETPVKEIVLATYGALSMQTVMIDERHGAGVLNLDAARWWQGNRHRLPLSRTPFLGTESA